jgi:hypothetical protein
MTVFFYCFSITLMFLFLWSVSVALRELVHQTSACIKFLVQISSFLLMATASNLQRDPVLLVLRKRAAARTLNLIFVWPMLISNIALNFTKNTQKYRQPLFQFPFNKGDRWLADSPLLQSESKLRLLIKKNTL